MGFYGDSRHIIFSDVIYICIYTLVYIRYFVRMRRAYGGSKHKIGSTCLRNGRSRSLYRSIRMVINDLVLINYYYILYFSNLSIGDFFGLCRPPLGQNNN